MNAHELFKEGKLADAIDTQVKEVKAHPGDNAGRLFLFELFAFAGDLERAGKQIDAVRYGDLERDATVDRYRRLLEAEHARREALRGGTPLTFSTEIPEHLSKRMAALREPGVSSLVEEADAEMTRSRISLNDNVVESLVDADDRFGPVLEVMADGKYYWVPWEHIATLAMNGPKYPRDLLWIPSRIELSDGQTGEVFLPALYPDSYQHEDDLVKLGRSTDWRPTASGAIHGDGQKTYLAGEEPIGILEWRELRVLGA